MFSSLSKLYDIHVHFICVPVSFSEAFTDTSAPAETCFRLCLPALLPDTLDRILYLEADMIATASLMPLYTLDFAGKKSGMHHRCVRKYFRQCSALKSPSSA